MKWSRVWRVYGRLVNVLSVASVLLLPVQASATDDTVRLLSWNIRLDTPADGADRWSYRADGVLALLQQQQADVIGLQEVLWSQLQRLEAGLPDYQRVGVGRNLGRADASETGEFSPLFVRKSRFELLDSGTFWLNATNQPGQAGWDAALPRICSWALLRDKHHGAVVRVLNMHLDHQGVEARRQSAALIGRYWQRWQQTEPAQRVLVMGDLNPAAGDGVLATFAEALPLHRDVLSVAPAPSGPRYSFYGWQQTPADGVRLDYMFVAPKDFAVRSAALLPAIRAQLPHEAKHSGRLSDHLPLWAELGYLQH